MAAALAALLKQEGFVGRCDSSDFVWAFEAEAPKQPVLTWLVDNLRRSDGFTLDAENDTSSQNVPGGRKFPSPRASDTFTGTQRGTVCPLPRSDDELKHGTLEELESQTQNLLKVSRHLTDANTRSESTPQPASAIDLERRIAAVKAELRRQNQGIQQTAESLASWLTSVDDVHHQHGSSWQLALTSLQGFREEDRKLQQELGKLQQVLQGTAVLEQGIHRTTAVRCGQSSISDAAVHPAWTEEEAAAMHGEGGLEAYDTRMLELRRLEEACCLAEVQHARAEAEEARCAAELAAAKALLSGCRYGSQPSTDTGRRRGVRAPQAQELHELEELERQQRELLAATEASCWQFAHLARVEVLQGDYEARLQQHAEAFARKRRYVNRVLYQTAIHTLLQCLMDVEHSQLQSVAGMMARLQRDLSLIQQLSEARTKQYARLTLRPVQKVVLPIRDNVLEAMVRLAELPCSAAEVDALDVRLVRRAAAGRGGPLLAVQRDLPCASLHALLRSIAQLQSVVKQGRSDSQHRLEAELPLHTQRVAAAVQHLQQLAMPCGTAEAREGEQRELGHAVQLRPQELEQLLKLAQKTSAKLTEAVKAVTAEHEKNERILQTQRPEKLLERSVLHKFFCKPNTLALDVRGLDLRLQPGQR